MALPLNGDVPSSSEWGDNRDRKRKRKRSSSSSSPDSANDSTGKRAGSAQSGDSSKSVEVRPGSLMEALIESKEKDDSSRRHKKSKKKKKKKEERTAEKESVRETEKKDKNEVAVESKPVLEPATVAGAASDELDLTLKKEDLEENYDTDEEEEARDRRERLDSQRLKSVERKTIEFAGENTWNHEEVLARFEEEVREDIKRKKESQQSVPLLHTPSLHANCKCARSNGDRRDAVSSSSASEGEGSEDSDDVGKKEQRDKRRKASIRKRNKRRKTKQSEAAAALIKLEVDWRRHHPSALSSEMVFNVHDMLNESPACRCSMARKEEGMRHNHYLGETKLESTVHSCSISSLHHYVLSVNPNPSGQMRRKNEINLHTDGSYHFDGFSLLSHRPLPPILPPEPQHKWTDEYRFALEEDEKLTEQTVGSIRALDSLFSYITEDILELFDLKRWPEEVERERRYRTAHGLQGSREEEEIADGCPLFHVVPRFVRRRKDGTHELAPVSAVLEHITESYGRPFCSEEMSEKIHDVVGSVRAFEDFAESEKEGLVIDATRRPSSLRVDSIERRGYGKGDEEDDGQLVITHMTWRPTPFMLAARPDYQKAANELAEKKAELLAGTEEKRKGENGETKEEGEVEDKKISPEEEKELRSAIASLEGVVQKIKGDCLNRRELPISLSSKHFRRTGFKADLAQHTILLIMTMNHVRFHWALEKLEERISYKFEDRTLIELALSHPSYNANYGTNPDHARNAINLCGVRKLAPRWRQHLDGPRMQHEILDLKRGRNRKKDLDRLVEIADGMPGGKKLQINPGTINERLEFLGDSVVEMIVTVHLFFLLPHADEGLLATFRSALVQNKNLAALAQEIYLDKLMLMSHGVELLHEPEYRHATANSFEAFMAAIYLDSGKNMDHCERIYGEAMYGNDPEALEIWTNLKVHELQNDHPGTDRHLIANAQALQKLVVFEDSIGLKFAHICLLARAFNRSGTYNNLTKGDYQTLELLGDTILQMSTTEFLYKRFPLLHEGHLSLLRTCLVSNKTQAVICDDLDMSKYVLDLSPRRNQHKNLKMKDKADLVESLLGAIYVDRGWEYCRAFTRVCFFPRMKFFIDSHAWADPKSALQQLCLALPRPASIDRKLMPEYRIVAESGPTNMREYTIACDFRGKKISEGVAKTRHAAQMKAALEGMKNLPKFFPEEWAKYEQKVLQERSRREPIKKGGKGERTQGGRDAQHGAASFSGHPPYGSPSSVHFPHQSPSHFHPSPSFGYTQHSFNPRMISQYRGGPPPTSFLPTGAKPMNLMALDLQPPPAFVQPMQQSPSPAEVAANFAVAAPPGYPAVADSDPRPVKRSNKERKEEFQKKKKMEYSGQWGLAPPPPPPPVTARRPSTPLPPPAPPSRGCPVRAAAAAVVAPPPPDESPLLIPLPPPPPPLPPPESTASAQSEWVPLGSRSQHRAAYPSGPRPMSGQRPAFPSGSRTRPAPFHGPNGAPYSRPPMNGNGSSHRGVCPPPSQFANQNQQAKPKSLMDIPFEEMWGK